MELKIDAILPVLGIFSEKYTPDGYYDEIKLEEKLEIMSKIEGLSGLFVTYPLTPELPQDPDQLIRKLSNYNLVVSNILVRLWRDRKWKYGAYSTTEKGIRREAIKLFKEGIDFARHVRADSVLLWPAHDGFDYPFQTDYMESWNNLVETIREIGEYAKNVKIAIEYKCKDPRQKQYISNVGKLMMLINEIGLDNVGGALDIGHSFMAQENIAESLVILNRYKKLYQIHLNENYKDADPDMIFGTINFWENLEFFYYLSKTDFDGWLSLDIISPREDRVKSLQLSVRMVKEYKRLAEKLSSYSNQIDENLKRYNFVDNVNLLLDILFQGNC